MYRCVAWCIECHCNANKIDKEGKTPLDLAFEARTETDEGDEKEKENEIIQKNTISKLISAEI